MQFHKFTPKTKQLAKILSGGRSSQIVDLNVKTLRTTDAKILPKGCQLRRADVSCTLLITAVSING
jgi:hypothetical protein